MSISPNNQSFAISSANIFTTLRTGIPLDKQIVFGEDLNQDGSISKDELKTTEELKVLSGEDGLLDRADLASNNLQVKDAANDFFGFRFSEEDTLSTVFESIDFNQTNPR